MILRRRERKPSSRVIRSAALGLAFLAGTISVLIYVATVYGGPVRVEIGPLSFSSSQLFRPALVLLLSFGALAALGAKLPAKKNVGVLLVCLAAFSLPSFAPPSGDVVPSGYTALSIATGRGTSLDFYPELVEDGVPYFVTVTDHGLRSSYPLGPALLAWPLYLPASWSDVPRPELVGRVSRFSAILLALAGVWLALEIARKLDPPMSPEALALVFALGTSHGSVSSAALWQHGPGALWLLGALERMLSTDCAPGRRMLALGACLALAGWTRPILLVPAVLIGFAACIRFRGDALPALGSALGIGVAALFYNLHTYGSSLGAYSGHFWRMTETPLARAFENAFWLLFSPSRGVLWFEPVVIFALLIASTRALTSERKGTLGLGLLGFIAVWMTYSRFDMWWGGHCFGPRFMTDALPMWFLAVASLGPVARWCRWTMVSLAAVGASIAAAHFGGAGIDWNQRPSVDWFPERAEVFLDSELLTSLLSIEPEGELGLAQHASERGDRELELHHLREELSKRPWNRFAAVRIADSLVRAGRLREAQRQVRRFRDRWADDTFFRHLTRRLPSIARLMDGRRWLPARSAAASRNRELTAN
ncbi:MAG: hypothetical protein ACRD21_14490, partial [Vicinamibacteria bacterium]